MTSQMDNNSGCSRCGRTDHDGPDADMCPDDNNAARCAID